MAVSLGGVCWLNAAQAGQTSLDLPLASEASNAIPNRLVVLC